MAKCAYYECENEAKKDRKFCCHYCNVKAHNSRSGDPQMIKAKYHNQVLCVPWTTLVTFDEA